MGNLKHVYHFALKPSDSEAAATKQDQEGKVLPRRGTSMVSKMPDKTAELNSDERVSCKSNNCLNACFKVGFQSYKIILSFFES